MPRRYTRREWRWSIGAEASLLLPPGTRLLHIGPHETGTTSLQSAFHVHRAELAAQGVHYAGPNRQPMQAAHAVSGRPSPYADGKTPSKSRWRDLVAEVRAAKGSRVVISSEAFADADAGTIREVVRDLDPARLHVVVTLRPLASILPSEWQQYVQGGMTSSYETWLDAIFNKPDSTMTLPFWHRHRHHELVGRWADVVGRDHLAVVVADEGDREHLLQVFEQLLGLSPGTLVPEADLVDRELTRAEVETVRAFNLAFRSERLGAQLHAKVMRFGAAEHLKRRPVGQGEARIETPQWAVERAIAVGRDIAEGIASAGVRVVGDLNTMTVAPAARGETSMAEDLDATWADIGARLALGIALASGLARGEASKAWSQIPWPDGPLAPSRLPARARAEPPELARVSTPRLGLILARRGLGMAASRIRPARRPC